jgi:nucleotide-binding universal stress UspA family protein
MGGEVGVSKIVVGVDGSEYSEKIFKLACFIAAKCNTGLLIVNISEVLQAEGIVGFDLSKKARQELETGGNMPLLERCRFETNDVGVIDTQILTTSGHVAEMILRITDLEGVDMIILGRRDLNGPKKLLLGSVSYNVKPSCKVPCCDCKIGYILEDSK